jgi:hypothetical protein
MKRVLFGGLCLVLLGLCGCGSGERGESSSLVAGEYSSVYTDEFLSLFSDDLVGAAHATYVARLRATRGGTPDPTNEYYPRYWAPRIRELKPIKVYKHRINIVVVQRIEDGVEYGKYIHIPISSYLPMTGVDGFTYSPEPLDGKTYTLHNNGVFDYTRTIE